MSQPSSKKEFPIGKIDQYSIIRELGTGGFGSVYLARDTVSNTFVAVKGLPQQIKDSEDEMECIRHTFELSVRLKHDNIASALVLHPVQSVWYNDSEIARKLNVRKGDPLLVMDYAEGVTLSKWCRQFPERKVPLDKAIEVVRQVAEALDYAHKMGVIHRDIKPANVMVETFLDGNFKAKVLDFGLAAEIRSSMRRSGDVQDDWDEGVTSRSGTFQYMAPEQWQGKRQNAATDQYALAALFYELVTGDVPFSSIFDCGDQMLILSVVTTRILEIPKELIRKRATRKALARGLAKKPEKRFASCGDFVSALRGKRVFGHFVEGGQSSGFWRWLGFGALTAVILAGSGGAAYWAYGRYQQEQERKRIELRRLADQLEIQAQQARKDVEQLGYGKEPELANLYKQMEASFVAAEKASKANDLVATTNGYTNVCIFKSRLDTEKVRLDEVRRRRAHDQKVAELISRGYVPVIGNDGVTNAIWKAGTRHPKCADLVAESTPERWRSDKAGYLWDGKVGVVWKEGVVHPEHPHWMSQKTANKWSPDLGYASTNGTGRGFVPLTWIPGLEIGDRRTGTKEGTWENKIKCANCGGNGNVFVDETCAKCKGSCMVTTNKTCSSCSGVGSVSTWEVCPNCVGARNVQQPCSAGCQRITKAGRLVYSHGFQCDKCGGDGTVVNPIGMGFSIASIFIENLNVHPPTTMTCSKCSGVGAYQCASCNGVGFTLVQCTTCHGNGRVERSHVCSSCGGKRTIADKCDCTVCKDGKVRKSHTCEICGGHRQVWQEDAPGKAIHRMKSVGDSQLLKAINRNLEVDSSELATSETNKVSDLPQKILSENATATVTTAKPDDAPKATNAVKTATMSVMADSGTNRAPDSAVKAVSNATATVTTAKPDDAPKATNTMKTATMSVMADSAVKAVSNATATVTTAKPDDAPKVTNAVKTATMSVMADSAVKAVSNATATVTTAKPNDAPKATNAVKTAMLDVLAESMTNSVADQTAKMVSVSNSSKQVSSLIPSLGADLLKILGSWQCVASFRLGNRISGGDDAYEIVKAHLPASCEISLTCREDGTVSLAESAGHFFGKAQGTWQYQFGKLQLVLHAEDGLKYNLSGMVNWKGDRCFDFKCDSEAFENLLKQRCKDIDGFISATAYYENGENELMLIISTKKCLRATAFCAPWVFRAH